MNTNSGNDVGAGGSKPLVTHRLTTASSIDQLTLSYLRGEITFQDYETMIENQHFLAIAASASSSITNATTSSSSSLTIHHDHPHIVSSTIELATTNSSNAQAASSAALNDRFFSLRDIFDDADDDDQDVSNADESDFDRSSRNVTSRDDVMMMIGGEDTTMSQWNDFDIETLNFDKFIKDHQTSDKTTPTKSNKRKRGMDASSDGAGIGATSSTRLDDPTEIKAKKRVKINLFIRNEKRVRTFYRNVLDL